MRRARSSCFHHSALRPRAFLWRDGSMTDLGTIGGNHSQAAALSDAGHVVGRSQTPASSTTRPVGRRHDDGPDTRERLRRRLRRQRHRPGRRRIQREGISLAERGLPCWGTSRQMFTPKDITTGPIVGASCTPQSTAARHALAQRRHHRPRHGTRHGRQRRHGDQCVGQIVGSPASWIKRRTRSPRGLSCTRTA